MSKKRTKAPVKVIVVAACAVALVLLAFAAYQGRGWLRVTAIPTAVSSVYKPRVNNTFNKLFYPVNQKLATYGFKVEWNQSVECGEGSFEGFSETVSCSRMMALELPGYSNATVTQWQKGASGLVKYLESDGWEKRSRTQELSDLFTGRSTDQPLNVTYTKNRGSVQCELQLIYYGWEDNKDKAGGYETCRRTFNVLWGSGPNATY